MEYEAHRRGFPISLLIVPHSTLVNFLVFRLGNDSLRHRQNSLSPSKSGLEGRKKKEMYYCFRKKKQSRNALKETAHHHSNNC